jgi:hypothetical protein
MSLHPRNSAWRTWLRHAQKSQNSDAAIVTTVAPGLPRLVQNGETNPILPNLRTAFPLKWG